ncbi:MAG: L,D-transpeptidase [Beijerinckiaceae bacterium]|nr:L,D-transpeptidase [Beijerinckiaceae bacterium]
MLSQIVRFFARLAILALVVLWAAPASATVNISVNLAAQRMTVATSSGERHNWAISSGRMGFVTPRGVYRPQSLRRMHYSRKYGMAPMPHSIFFHKGWAIHGTSAVGALGRPASHGCIRLAPGNAAKLFSMVQKRTPGVRAWQQRPGR